MLRTRRGVIAAVTAGILMIGAPFAGVADAVPEEGPVVVPTAAAPVAVRQLGCTAGQTDFNTAPAAEVGVVLRAVSGSDMAPTARRVVAGRQPFYGTFEDLLVVSGIGPSFLDAIEASGRACLELPSTPPPVIASQVCQAGDRRIDVNRPGSRSALTTLFGAPTVERIVQEAPFTSVNFVVAERLAGSGGGALRKRAGDLCYTPPTIDTGEVRWGWVGGAGTTKVDHPEGASLVVPAGTVDSASGAWASIVPTDTNGFGSGPAFDFHIYGAWTGAGDVVYPVLPPDDYVSLGGNSWVPVVVHELADDDMHYGPAVQVLGDGRIGAEVTSLSELRVVNLPADSLQITSVGVAVPKSTLVAANTRYLLSRSRPNDVCSPDVTTADTSIARVVSSPDRLLTGTVALFRAPARTCLEGSFDEASLTARTTNTGGLVYNVSAWASNPGAVADVTYTSAANILMTTLMDTRGNGDSRTSGFTHGPGTVLNVFLPLDEDSTRLTLDYDPIATAAMVLAEQAGNIPGVGETFGLVDCVAAVGLDALDAAKIIQCAESVALGLGDDVLATRIRTALRGVVRVVSIYDLARDLTEAVAGVVDAVGGIQSVDGDLFYSYEPQSAPATDLEGRAIPAFCLSRLGARWTVNQACVDAYYAGGGQQYGGVGVGQNGGGGPDGTIVVDSGTHVLHRIGGASAQNPYPTTYFSYDGYTAYGMRNDPELYDCFAQRFLLRDWLPIEKVFNYHYTESIIQETCPGGLERPPLPANASNWILRESNGTAWFVDGNGDLRWIPDGSTYQCLAQTHWVLDNTPWAEIEVFEAPVYPGDMTCS